MNDSGNNNNDNQIDGQVDDSAPAARRFQESIYRDLDQRLKNSQWNSGASEAHGLLSALACRGVSGERLRTQARLFRLSEKADVDLLEGMYGLILRELNSDGFEFSLLLLDDLTDERLESLTDWCSGFVQGFLYDAGDDVGDGRFRLDDAPERVRESFNDIMEISQVTIDADADAEQTERQLVEVEEYLRVAIQVIFEELNPDAGQPELSNLN